MGIKKNENLWGRNSPGEESKGEESRVMKKTSWILDTGLKIQKYIDLVIGTGQAGFSVTGDTV